MATEGEVVHHNDGDGGDRHGDGPVACVAWIRRSDKYQFKKNQGKQQQQQQQQLKNLVVMGRSRTRSSPPILEIFSFDPNTDSLSSSPLSYCVVDGNPLVLAVHPSGDEIVCSTADGCRLFELNGQDLNIKLLAKGLPPLQDIGPQRCLAFSTDGSKFATGGADGQLRVFEWPSLSIILNEPKAHKSFRDMDISLDSEFLVSTCIDGSARIWKISDGVPLISLTRSSDEKIECCRFSRDGTKPFLFGTVQKGNKGLTAVWDMSTWKRIGHKRLLRKHVSVLSVSLDGKYLALGSNDGDMCVVEVKKMEISHWSKKLHLGTSISSIEFCPTERVVLSTSSQWGATVTRLNVPADWKEWQIYLLLLGLFLASLVVFYIIYENSDSFWNFPLGKDQPARPSLLKAFASDPHPADNQNAW